MNRLLNPESLQEIRSVLAPGGTLRAGVNLSNALLVNAQAGGKLHGVAPDIAMEFGKRLGLAVELIPFESPGKLADAVAQKEVGIGFLAADPAREAAIDFTQAYVEVEATYLVPPGSKILTVADVDQAGVTISVVSKSAYEMWLTRNIKSATLVHAPDVQQAIKKFSEEKLDALAGLKPRLIIEAARLDGSKIVEGSFTAIQQAIGTRKSAGPVAACLREFVEDIKREGLVQLLIERNKVSGLSVGSSRPV